MRLIEIGCNLENQWHVFPVFGCKHLLFRHAPGVRNGQTGQPWRGVQPPPGKHWQYPPRTLDEMDARGEIYWSPTGNPRRKIYLDQSEGVPVQDLWLDFRDAHNQNIAVSGYPTEKNPDLIQRIIEASSNPSDLVLDCFAGSGTTLSVASHLGRRWIGMDNSCAAITATLRRFGKGLELMGDFVTKPEASGTNEEGDPMLALFGSKEVPDPLPTETSPHRIIKDFALLTAEPYEDELSGAVQEWKEWVGEPAVLQLCQPPVPYKVGKPKPRKVAQR